MAYVVFEDLETKDHITKPSDVSVKIHRDSCRFYINRKPDAGTVRWSEGLLDLTDAEDFAERTGKTWARARCCP